MYHKHAPFCFRALKALNVARINPLEFQMRGTKFAFLLLLTGCTSVMQIGKINMISHA
jgi:hypothetical protein